jgi:hypothetical protein
MFFALIGCGSDSDKGSIPVGAPACRGYYTARDESGVLKKYNEFEVKPGVCWVQSVPLTRWEATEEGWKANKYKCAPVADLSSMTLIASENFYTYRDEKMLIDLDAETGIYRKIFIGTSKEKALVYDRGVRTITATESPVFRREQGCIFKRTGEGADSSYGTQILLDTEKYISNEYFVPFEIYKIEEETQNSIKLKRFDNTSDWDEKFCPELSTPWGFCDFLKNGDYMYYPLLTEVEKNLMLSEAIKIRSEFSFRKGKKEDFELLWANLPNTHFEAIRTDWVYEVDFLVDTPPWIDLAWRDYVMGKRPRMPVRGSM